MGNWVGNLITAFATISGVLIAQLVTVRIERNKRQRENEIRWLERKQAAYADLMSAALSITRLAGEVDSNDRSPSEKECKDQEMLVADRGELAALLSPEMEEVINELVLSSQGLLTVALLARQDIRRSSQEEQYLPGIGEVESMSDTAHREWGESWDAFVVAARDELGVLKEHDSPNA